LIRVYTPDDRFTPRKGKFLDILVGDHNDWLAPEESFERSTKEFDRDIVQDEVVGDLGVLGPVSVGVEDQGVVPKRSCPFRFTVAGGPDKEQGLRTFGSWMLKGEI